MLDQNRIQDLEFLFQQPRYQELRPCHNCNKPCSCSQSVSCTCMCGPDCEHVPLMLSSDPDIFPIEGKIVSLVFGLNCLRVCPPYWSCEGHNFPNGELFKVPQVWFYSRSMIYPKMIGDYISNLKYAKKIHFPWHVCIGFAEDSLETGFSIEPDVKAIEQPNLKLMQEDVKVIADNLISGLKNRALDYIKKYKLEVNTG